MIECAMPLDFGDFTAPLVNAAATIQALYGLCAKPYSPSTAGLCALWLWKCFHNI